MHREDLGMLRLQAHTASGMGQLLYEPLTLQVQRVRAITAMAHLHFTYVTLGLQVETLNSVGDSSESHACMRNSAWLTSAVVADAERTKTQ